MLRMDSSLFFFPSRACASTGVTSGSSTGDCRFACRPPSSASAASRARLRLRIESVLRRLSDSASTISSSCCVAASSAISASGAWVASGSTNGRAVEFFHWMSDTRWFRLVIFTSCGGDIGSAGKRGGLPSSALSCVVTSRFFFAASLSLRAESRS
jgi:hypothetical protein